MWPRFWTNFLGAVLLLALGSEIVFFRMAGSQNLTTTVFYGFLAFIPSIAFIFCRTFEFSGCRWVERWWPSLGIGFLAAIFMMILMIITDSR